MEEKTKPIRPFSLEYTEAKNKIINAVNEAVQIHGIPFYLLEEIIANISYQVQTSASIEREKAKATYEKQKTEG